MQDWLMQFTEEQRFSPKLISLVSASVAILVGLGLWLTPPEDRLPALIVALLAVAIIPAFYFVFKLRTRTGVGELEVRFPFNLGTTIPLSDIAAVDAVRYRPLRDFGGWGVRLGREGTMYSASGDRAVKLTLKCGRIIFVGSQRPDDLARAIRSRGMVS